jgi:hypothetical protein
MPTSSPKRIKREIRELAAKLQEIELRSALNALALDVQRWQRGEIDSYELNDLIHRFHHGPSREIYNRYSTGGDPAPFVARAIVSGQLDPATVSPEVLAELARPMGFLRAQQDASDQDE